MTTAPGGVVTLRQRDLRLLETATAIDLRAQPIPARLAP